jgi:hypothetical protein
VTNYIEIVAETGHTASTSWDTNKYHLYPDWTRQAGTAINWSRGFTRFRGLQIGIATQTNTAEIVYWSQGDSGFMDGCLIKGLNNTNYITRGISIAGGNIFNTIVYNLGNYYTTVAIQTHVGPKLYNCTLLSGGAIVVNNDGGTIVAKNCYAGGSQAKDWNTEPGSTTTLTTCSSSDGTGSVGLTNIIANATTFSNVTAGAEDFRLITGSPLVNVGTDTSGDAAPFNFTNGIRGNVRSGSWDIGADEL